MKKYFKQINWPSALGEILLLFIGINLAIWFNNWNENNRHERRQKQVLALITNELETNQQELTTVRAQWPEAIELLQRMTDVLTPEGSIEQSVSDMHAFNQEFPGFFEIVDSTLIEKDIYRYRGSFNVFLNLYQLSDVAWRTAQSTNSLDDISFACLMELSNTYQLQTKITDLIDRLILNIQQRDFKEMLRIIEFLQQFESQMDDRYKAALTQIIDCKT